MPHRRPGFVLLLALTLLAAVAALGTVLALHVGHLISSDRSRTIEAQLRQMIDSGAAYARQHCADWPADAAPVVIDATDLAGGHRAAEITLDPTFGVDHQVESVKVAASITMPRGQPRTMRAGVVVSSRGL